MFCSIPSGTGWNKAAPESGQHAATSSHPDMITVSRYGRQGKPPTHARHTNPYQQQTSKRRHVLSQTARTAQSEYPMGFGLGKIGFLSKLALLKTGQRTGPFPKKKKSPQGRTPKTSQRGRSALGRESCAKETLPKKSPGKNQAGPLWALNQRVKNPRNKSPEIFGGVFPKSAKTGGGKILK